MILNVAEGGAAEKAGLHGPRMSPDGRRIVLGDVIVAVNDTPTPDSNTLLNTLERYEVGNTVQLTVVRNGEKTTVPVTLQAIQ
jgi:S1-C subfamily serine protease